MSVNWDKEGQERTVELHQQLEEGISVSAWQTRQIDQVLGAFPELFADTSGVAQGMAHHIHTPPGMVVRALSRPVPITLQNTIEREVQMMLQLGVIEPFESPWRSPLVLVPRPDGSTISTFDAYPMPMRTC